MSNKIIKIHLKNNIFDIKNIFINNYYKNIKENVF